MAGPLACSQCQRWCCGLCRVGKAILDLPFDSRITNANYDLATSILERALGEVNSWLAVPLQAPPSNTEQPSIPPDTGGNLPEGSSSISEPQSDSGERSPKRKDTGKDKRSHRNQERRRERLELRPRPPTPPPPPARTSRGASEDRSHFQQWGRCAKKNKGKKHRERGIAYRDRLVGKDRRGGAPDGSSPPETSCREG